jgi:8-oxo-dGTP diphosphatase
MERYTVPIGVGLLLIKGEKILLMKRKNTGYADGMFGCPSGHLDPGEWMLDGMVREAKEEVGITISKKDLKFAHAFHKRPYGKGDLKTGMVAIYFTVSKWKGKPINAEPDKCSGIEWYSIDRLPENTVGTVKQVVKNYLKGIPYSQFEGYK